MNTTLLEEINANLMENAKEEVEFLIKEISAIKTQLVAEIKGEDIDISSDTRGGGTPIYGLYRYVPRNRVWFLRFSVLK